MKNMHMRKYTTNNHYFTRLHVYTLFYIVIIIYELTKSSANTCPQPRKERKDLPIIKLDSNSNNSYFSSFLISGIGIPEIDTMIEGSSDEEAGVNGIPDGR
jgi:hypothetical protein